MKLSIENKEILKKSMIAISIILLLPIALAQTYSFYEVNLFYDSHKISLQDIEIKTTNFPERISNIPGEYTLKVLSFKGEEIYSSSFEIPLEFYYDTIDEEIGKIMGGGSETLSSTEFDLAIPYYDNAKEFSIYDELGNIILTAALLQLPVPPEPKPPEPPVPPTPPGPGLSPGALPEQKISEIEKAQPEPTQVLKQPEPKETKGKQTQISFAEKIAGFIEEKSAYFAMPKRVFENIEFNNQLLIVFIILAIILIGFYIKKERDYKKYDLKEEFDDALERMYVLISTKDNKLLKEMYDRIAYLYNRMSEQDKKRYAEDIIMLHDKLGKIIRIEK